MRNIFGWSYPPGCSSVPGDEPDGPLDCPICADEVELSEECPTCKQDMLCPKHGCVACLELEKRRKIDPSGGFEL
jgi:hypothetical protein